MKLGQFVGAIAAVTLLAWSGGAHAARYFVENTLGDVPAEQAATVTETRPVQLLFEFRTSGAPNARGTEYLAEQITARVTESGFFSEVSTNPVEGGAILSVIFDNIPQADAAQRGIGVGLTFGLMGTAVADYYVATFEYASGPDAERISKEVRHTLISTIGNTDAPENATRVRNMETAIETITRQLIAHGLNNLASDPAFPGATPVAVAAETAPADPAAAPAEANAETPAETPAEPTAQPAPAN